MTIHPPSHLLWNTLSDTLPAARWSEWQQVLRRYQRYFRRASPVSLGLGLVLVLSVGLGSLARVTSKSIDMPLILWVLSPLFSIIVIWIWYLLMEGVKANKNVLRAELRTQSLLLLRAVVCARETQIDESTMRVLPLGLTRGLVLTPTHLYVVDGQRDQFCVVPWALCVSVTTTPFHQVQDEPSWTLDPKALRVTFPPSSRVNLQTQAHTGLIEIELEGEETTEGLVIIRGPWSGGLTLESYGESIEKTRDAAKAEEESSADG